MNAFIFSFFTFLITYFSAFGMDLDDTLDSYSQRSLTHCERANGYKDVGPEDDLEKFLFGHIFNKTKRMSHTHNKILEIARKSDFLVLRYAVHSGFFHKMNTKFKVSQLRHVSKIPLSTLYTAHAANLLSSSDLRDRQHSLYYLQGISNSSLTQLLSVLDFSLFDISMQHVILKHLQAVDPDSLAIMIGNQSLSFRKVGINGGYKGQKHLEDRLKILEELKGKTPAFVEKATQSLTREELTQNQQEVISHLKVGEWVTLIDALSPGKKAFIEETRLLDGCTNRQKNKTIKSVQKINMDVLTQASQSGFLNFNPRERVRILKALQEKTIENLEGIQAGNSKLIIRALFGKI